MKKLLLIFCVIFAYGVQIESKITNTKKNLINTKTKISQMNAKLDDIIKKLNKEESSLEDINTKIKNLNSKIYLLTKKLKTNKQSLNNLIQQKTKLLIQKNQLENEVIDFISNNYYTNNLKIISSNDLINEEILKLVTKQSGNKMAKISQMYVDISNKISSINKLIYEISNAKKILEIRKQKIALLKNRKINEIKHLEQTKIEYKNSLKRIIKSQMLLQQQLAKLNIVKQNKAKQIELQKLKKTSYKYNKNIDKVKVKNYGRNIVMNTKTIRYRGPKTIPPTKGIITKKFGYYKDPVYNIDIFNDSITIKTRPLAKVRAILPGRVVFIGDTSDGKMIVISHKHRLHSVYARLSRLSPFIKKGYRVKKGEIIAKDSGELEFEVTYKTSPIDPKSICNF